MAGDTTRLAGVSQRHATGQKALIAEVLCAGVAIGPGLPVPELVLVEVDPLLGRSEPDEEVQNLLTSSPGLNLGMDFLPGDLGFDRADLIRGGKPRLRTWHACTRP